MRDVAKRSQSTLQDLRYQCRTTMSELLASCLLLETFKKQLRRRCVIGTLIFAETTTGVLKNKHTPTHTLRSAALRFCFRGCFALGCWLLATALLPIETYLLYVYCVGEVPRGGVYGFRAIFCFCKNK